MGFPIETLDNQKAQSRLKENRIILDYNNCRAKRRFLFLLYLAVDSCVWLTLIMLGIHRSSFNHFASIFCTSHDPIIAQIARDQFFLLEERQILLFIIECIVFLAALACKILLCSIIVNKIIKPVGLFEVYPNSVILKYLLIFSQAPISLTIIYWKRTSDKYNIQILYFIKAVSYVILQTVVHFAEKLYIYTFQSEQTIQKQFLKDQIVQNRNLQSQQQTDVIGERSNNLSCFLVFEFFLTLFCLYKSYRLSKRTLKNKWKLGRKIGLKHRYSELCAYQQMLKRTKQFLKNTA